MAMVMWPVRWHGSLNSLSVVSTPPITGGGFTMLKDQRNSTIVQPYSFNSNVLLFFHFIYIVLYSRGRIWVARYEEK